MKERCYDKRRINARLDTWRKKAEIFQLREMMKLFPTGGRFISCRFTLYKRLANNRYAEQGNKMTLLCAQGKSPQIDLDMTFNYFIKRNDLTSKENWQIKRHIIFCQTRWPKPMPQTNFPDRN